MSLVFVAWPNGSWSVLFTRSKCELPHIMDCIDASADPSIASIFVAETEGGELYADLPERQECGLPLLHWGDLRPLQLRPPYDTLWKEWSAGLDELLGPNLKHSAEVTNETPAE